MKILAVSMLLFVLTLPSFAGISSAFPVKSNSLIIHANNGRHIGQILNTPTVVPTAAPTPVPTAAPTPVPAAAPTSYSYIMSVSGSNYQVLNGATNAVLYQSTSSSAACNYLLGPSGIASNGNTIYVKSGAYTVDAQWNIAISGVTVTFQSGAVLTATNAYNTGEFGIYVSGSNVVLANLVSNGNGLNQQPSPKSPIGNSGNVYNQFYMAVGFAGNNNLIQNSTIYNWRSYGIESLGSNNGVMNSKVYDIGANGIVLLGNANYAINNEVYHCSDVGIGSWDGTNAVITGNYVHDLTSDLSPMWGFGPGSFWGIGVENSGGGSGNGNYLFIAGNTVKNTMDGIVTNQPNILISGNTIESSGWLGIRLYDSASNVIIEYNTINGAPYGISVESGTNNQYGNNFSSISSGNFYPTGIPVSNNQPSTVAVTVTSSQADAGVVTANGIAGYAGSYSTGAYTFYATIGSSVTLSANPTSGYTFSRWSDGGAQTHSITVQSSDITYTATFT